MLLFKPAPIYILDEVDAALDLSHTQNIGQMLRTHFRHSQVCNVLIFNAYSYVLSLKIKLSSIKYVLFVFFNVHVG